MGAGIEPASFFLAYVDGPIAENCIRISSGSFSLQQLPLALDSAFSNCCLRFKPQR